MAKTFETVKEINADDILKKIEEVGGSIIKKIETGVEYLSEKVGTAVEEGNKYRISIRDKDGDEKFKVTATLGVLGVTIASLFSLPITFLVGAVSFFLGSAHEYKLVIEKVVETPETEQPIGQKGTGE